MNLSDRTINPLTTRRAVYQQSEGAILPYTIDWGVLLNGDKIQRSTWSAPGLTIVSDHNETQTTAKLSGRAGTYVAKNTIETQGGIVEERSIKLTITAEPQTVGADYGINER